ncbi:hypothetical protein M0R45_000082 [Rubus argutus]|uniref:non-specific serine/threonine protein kinase n=1 Tax=Rubus argutus TaxID=59490 RepID=A0AAW1VNM1_RUBAR
MSTEASARLISILSLILTLCQLGSEFKSQSIAQKLPDEEARALYAVARTVNSETPILSNYTSVICNGTKIISDFGDVIGFCNCKLQNGTNICHIIRVKLSSRSLSGVIPDEVINLTHLEALDLSGNQLTGSIPTNLGNLSSLYELDLSNNQLTGSIPESLGNMKFQLLRSLSGNQLSGPIPETLGNITASSVTSDLDAYRLFKLKKYMASVDSNFNLDLSNNQLTGPIPEILGNLPFIAYLDLSNNFLNGSIPVSLGALTYLLTIRVGSNRITGILPKSFASLTRLSQFSVAANNLSGPVPDFIANWTSIMELSLGGNNFYGNIPIGIFSLSKLEILAISDVGDSHFRFPPSTNLFNLKTLILRNCSINGHIPAYIGDMSLLSNLDLSFNILTGSIPDSLKKLNLSYMSFSSNRLSGAIPDWILDGNVTDLSYNNFSKLLFKPSPKVNLFACCCNSSSCIDPTQIVKKNCPRGKPNYHSLFINCGGEIYNSNDGNVYDKDNDTSQFYQSPNRNWARSSAGSSIHSVRCGLSSEAPLYNKARASPVSLKYYGFCLSKGNYNVTLHFAEIVEGKNYTTDKRSFHVYIQGERKLIDFNIIDEAGGPNKPHTENFTAINVNHSTILEIHLYSAGEWNSSRGPLISAISVTPEYKLGKGKHLSHLHTALITMASTIVFVLLLLLLYAWMIGWLGNTDRSQEIDIGLEKVTLKQLKDATRNFSKRNEISQGHFGTVYKAELQGKIVAVKRLYSHSDDRIDQLKNEFYTLKSMSHQNLVQLLDVYNTKGLHLLIYEYMQNNSLAHALFDSKSKLKLDWEARFNICLGIARGLAYLHEHPRLKMVHRDIKPSNILLDRDLTAKISDFGLASLYTEDDQFKFIKVEVPQGYMSPEYVRGIVTSKADVYSFGVVILETVSGRTNAGHMRDSQESEFLLDTAYDLHRKGRLVDLVDKNLSTKYDAKQAIIILNLAVKCTNISPTLRPTMSQVVSVLVGDKKIEEICLPASNDSHIAQVDSSAFIEVTSRASTSSDYFRGADEIEHIAEGTP